ncbi:uncharacterized protein EV422DRAFT_595272 [Fimicolochytrium jonesii]|uniref:uncharacterized protein n=1 Tax=Fimicolochytrium jonesii TaxID=1396493 RepID=UPI0022FE24B4|nr:uncharacterized protein EV422DRAFT_595272 [Fimicolochytrium jonesii]KAI8821045.1 hypothetical protein EV422DRAFT_595272 [Fimicolochytrium jonesii]
MSRRYCPSCREAAAGQAAESAKVDFSGFGTIKSRYLCTECGSFLSPASDDDEDDGDAKKSTTSKSKSKPTEPASTSNLTPHPPPPSSHAPSHAHAATTPKRHPNPSPTSLLTSNLLPYLRTLPLLTRLHTTAPPPTSDIDLTAWTKLNAPYRLPDDVRRFFAVADGLRIEWGVGGDGRGGELTAGRKAKEITVGVLEILPLRHWTRLDGTRKPTPTTGFAKQGTIPPPSPKGGAAFLIQHCEEYGSTCLVFPAAESTSGDISSPHRTPPPHIAFFDPRSMTYRPIATTFTAYFRLMVMHMGVRGWQTAWTEAGMRQEVMDWVGFYVPAWAGVYRRWWAGRRRGGGGERTVGSRGGTTSTQSAPMPSKVFDADRFRAMMASTKPGSA